MSLPVAQCKTTAGGLQTHNAQARSSTAAPGTPTLPPAAQHPSPAGSPTPTGSGRWCWAGHQTRLLLQPVLQLVLRAAPAHPAAAAVDATLGWPGASSSAPPGIPRVVVTVGLQEAECCFAALSLAVVVPVVAASWAAGTPAAWLVAVVVPAVAASWMRVAAVPALAAAGPFAGQRAHLMGVPLLKATTAAAALQL